MKLVQGKKYNVDGTDLVLEELGPDVAFFRAADDPTFGFVLIRDRYWDPENHDCVWTHETSGEAAKIAEIAEES